VDTTWFRSCLPRPSSWSQLTDKLHLLIKKAL